MREIQEQADQGKERARLALDMFCYRIKKVVGAYSAVLGRLDALVFTGGIGENSVHVRSQVCSGMEPMGICVDEGKNGAASGEISELQPDGAPVKVLVIRTDEEREIARQTIRVIDRSGSEHPARAASGATHGSLRGTK
jgi:acetate kinase